MLFFFCSFLSGVSDSESLLSTARLRLSLAGDCTEPDRLRAVPERTERERDRDFLLDPGEPEAAEPLLDRFAGVPLRERLFCGVPLRERPLPDPDRERDREPDPERCDPARDPDLLRDRLDCFCWLVGVGDREPDRERDDPEARDPDRERCEPADPERLRLFAGVPERERRLGEFELYHE